MGSEYHRESTLVDLLNSFGDVSDWSRGTKRKRERSEEDPQRDSQMEAILNRLTSSVSKDNVVEVRAHLSKIRIPAEQLTVGSWLSRAGKRQYPLLHYAAREGSVHVLRFLIEEKGLDPNQYAAAVGTALSRAVHSENEECVRYLLTTTCDVNTPVPVCQLRECRMNHVTPLMIALSRNSLAIVKMLLDTGKVDINKTTTFSESALYFAIKHPSMSQQLVQVILDAGIDTSIKSTTDVPPLHLAFKLGRREVVKQLVAAGCDVNVKQETPGAFGFTALHFAAEMNDSELIRLLVSAGADLNAKTDANATLSCSPLLYTVAGNRCYQAMSVLLDLGADITSTDKFGRGIIHWLVLNGDDAPLAFVLSSFKKVKPDHVAHDGMPTTPLDYAMTTSNLPAMKLLLSHNCKITKTTTGSDSSLDKALKRGILAEMIPYLHKAGYDVSAELVNALHLDHGKELGVHPALRHDSTFMGWVKDATSRPRSLQDICRNKIRSSLSHDILNDVETLPLPTTIKKFIKNIE